MKDNIYNYIIKNMSVTIKGIKYDIQKTKKLDLSHKELKKNTRQSMEIKIS